MLSGRTKQVVSYGRRGRRIVNAPEEYRHSENNEVEVRDSYSAALEPTPPRKRTTQWEPSPEVKFTAKRKPVQEPCASSKPSRKAAMKTKRSPKAVKVGKAEVTVPVRHPLALFSPNTPGSPAVPSRAVKKRGISTAKASPLKSSSPTVNVEIVVLDNKGRRVSQERRVSRTDIQVNGTDAAATGYQIFRQPPAQPRYPDLSSDATEYIAPKPAKMKRRSKARPIVISDDSDTDDECNVPLAKLPRLDFSVDHPQRPSCSYSTNSPTSLPSIRSHIRPSHNQAAAPGAAQTTYALPPPASAFVLWDITSKPSVPTSKPTSPSPVPHRTKARKPIPDLHSRPFLVPGHSPFPRATKARQVTPYRAHRGRASLFPAPPSPPSPTTPTDYDLSLDFANLALSPATRRSVEADDAHAVSQPAHLLPLLQECTQETPHEFSAFIELFPMDPIVHGDYFNSSLSRGNRGKAPATFQKIGEASYSEVFGIGDVVLKVIPLRDEEHHGESADDSTMESPAPSDAKDVLKEIFVTRAMGDMCPGFVKLLRTYVVRGKYPSLLLDLWDQYNVKKGSESVRPDAFGVSQVYAIIVLPNGGPDLETFIFKTATKTGWKQACSLFWQVVRSLAEAEELVRFEHRDLHWGQILVKTVTATSTEPHGVGKMPMDDEAHGIEATVIDLGLARMETSDNGSSEAHWTPFEEEIFEGEGDYQFDVYRMMRVHNSDSWEEYRPLTNVMWLHYLASKLLHSKRLRPPPAARKASTRTSGAVYTERECYNCLVEMEELLGRCVAVCKPQPVGRSSRRKTQASTKAVKLNVTVDPSGPMCAKDVLLLAIERGWVHPS